MRERKNHGFIGGCHNSEIFAVLPVKGLLYWAPVHVFWYDIRILRILRVPSSLYLACYSCVLFGDNDCGTQRVQRMMTLKFVVLTLCAFLRTVCHGATTRFHGARIQQVYEWRGTLVSLNTRTWTLLGRYGIVGVLSSFDVDPIRYVFALAPSYKVNFYGEGRLRWFPYDFRSSFVLQVAAHEGVNQEGAFTGVEVSISY